MAKKADENYSPEEAQKRFEAALRGARIAGHKPMLPFLETPGKKETCAQA